MKTPKAFLEEVVEKHAVPAKIGGETLRESPSIASPTFPTSPPSIPLSVFWIPGYPGPPAPGPLQLPNFGPGVNRQPEPNGEDPHGEAPHEENDD
jgi:hypothetical protein